MKVQRIEMPEFGRESLDVAAESLYTHVVAVIRLVHTCDVRVRFDGECYLGTSLRCTRGEASYDGEEVNDAHFNGTSGLSCSFTHRSACLHDRNG